ncbi:MAG: MmcQ/YjbR family DNA-binding protein [Bacteroidota bacterium]
MHLDDLYTYALAKPGAWEDAPFGPDVLVLKVRKKMFAMANVERQPLGVALKSDPERWLDLKERYDGVTEGPYLDGKHWNLVRLQSDVPSSLIRDLVDRSYDLVVAGMTRKERAALEGETQNPAT